MISCCQAGDLPHCQCDFAAGRLRHGAPAGVGVALRKHYDTINWISWNITSGSTIRPTDLPASSTVAIGRPLARLFLEPQKRHCQSKFYTACSRTRAGWSFTVFVTDHQRAWPDSTPKIAYTYLP